MKWHSWKCRYINCCMLGVCYLSSQCASDFRHMWSPAVREWLTPACTHSSQQSSKQFNIDALSRLTQTGWDDGDLGNPLYGEHQQRRLRAQGEDWFKELHQLPSGSSAVVKMPTELGVNAPDSGLLSLMYDVITVREPTRTATADILHVDGQVKSSATVEYIIKEL